MYIMILVVCRKQGERAVEKDTRLPLNGWNLNPLRQFTRTRFSHENIESGHKRLWPMEVLDFYLQSRQHLQQQVHTSYPMGIKKRTRKFVQTKRVIGQRDARLYDLRSLSWS